MDQRKLGNSELMVAPIGLGCNRLLDAHDADAVAAAHKALDLGINHFDGADMYGFGRGETFLGKVLQERRGEVVIASKFGFVRSEDGAMKFVGTPEYVRQACDASLSRLGIDHIDLYYQHRIDPNIAIEETWGAMVELVNQGKVGALGISNATEEQIRRAHAVHPLAAVQMEYSLIERAQEAGILPTCKELGVTFVAYGPLSFSLLGGDVKNIDDLPEDDAYRRRMPRFHDENIGANLKLVETVISVAGEIGATPGQVALAWTMCGAYDVIPIPGSRRPLHLEENTKAADIQLSGDQMRRLNDASGG
ncbi:MAG: aldo/keto reductase [Rhodospirillales bacterium]|jgi:aryl-alcohol dehydrogenase-like predicted oxidoreductase|nr:aldo/keto reductase [Rhodospirillaceae bacterium]MDP6426674.1 aldo/keto reductase [Rhodospirillales bacterium]MDP6645905.1 aldo/keto reductase [Rhodospirillales bacterium]MDP6840762.1 aldo/keto reductase [Rhodospirillales bacterium]